MPVDYRSRAIYISEKLFLFAVRSLELNASEWCYGEVLLSELFLIPRLIYALVLIGRTMMISLITSIGECKCVLLMHNKLQGLFFLSCLAAWLNQASFGVGYKLLKSPIN